MDKTGLEAEESSSSASDCIAIALDAAAAAARGRDPAEGMEIGMANTPPAPATAPALTRSSESSHTGNVGGPTERIAGSEPDDVRRGGIELALAVEADDSGVKDDAAPVFFFWVTKGTGTGLGFDVVDAGSLTLFQVLFVVGIRLDDLTYDHRFAQTTPELSGELGRDVSACHGFLDIVVVKMRT